MKKLALSATAILGGANAALANTCGPANPLDPVCDVPEISAMEGAAAVVVVLAVVALIWERRRRAS